MSFLAQHANDIVFAGATVSGMVAHYVKKSLKSETGCKITEWFGSQHLPGSIASLGSACMVVVAALSQGVITPDMEFWPVVYIGLTTGYAVDSTANSDGSSKPKEETK